MYVSTLKQKNTGYIITEIGRCIYTTSRHDHLFRLKSKRQSNVKVIMVNKCNVAIVVATNYILIRQRTPL